MLSFWAVTWHHHLTRTGDIPLSSPSASPPAGKPAMRLHRPILLTLSLLAVAATLWLPAQWGMTVRLLLGWNLLCWSYMAILWLVMWLTPAHQIEPVARRLDENAAAVLVAFVLAMLTALAAIVYLLATPQAITLPIWLPAGLLATLTLLGAWFLLPTLLTLHYAHLYYLAQPQQTILGFPDDIRQPDYMDFAYFSFTIAVAAQTADISLNSQPIRRMVLVHSILTFFFNSSVLGLSINIISGLIH